MALRVKGRLAAKPEKLVTSKSAEYSPTARPFAAAVRLTMTVVSAPPARMPLDGKTFNHDGELVMFQNNELPLWLVNAKFCDVTSNGPPLGPEVVKPLAGETSKG